MSSTPLWTVAQKDGKAKGRGAPTSAFGGTLGSCGTIITSHVHMTINHNDIDSDGYDDDVDDDDDD